jgi:hypothetical protein
VGCPSRGSYNRSGSMKITQKKILQMTRSVLRGQKQYGEHQLLHPAREWSIGLVSFGVLCALGVWWAGTVYLRYVDVSTLRGDAVVPETTTYRGAQVAQALEILDAHSKEYAVIISRYGTLPVGGSITTPVFEAEEPVIASTTDEVVEISATTSAQSFEAEEEVVAPTPVEVPEARESVVEVPTLAD